MTWIVHKIYLLKMNCSNVITKVSQSVGKNLVSVLGLRRKVGSSSNRRSCSSRRRTRSGVNPIKPFFSFVTPNPVTAVFTRPVSWMRHWIEHHFQIWNSKNVKFLFFLIVRLNDLTRLILVTLHQTTKQVCYHKTSYDNLTIVLKGGPPLLN